MEKCVISHAFPLFIDNDSLKESKVSKDIYSKDVCRPFIGPAPYRKIILLHLSLLIGIEKIECIDNSLQVR